MRNIVLVTVPMFVWIEMQSSTFFSYTEKHDWICRGADSYTLDSDGKSTF